MWHSLRGKRSVGRVELFNLLAGDEEWTRKFGGVFSQQSCQIGLWGIASDSNGVKVALIRTSSERWRQKNTDGEKEDREEICLPRG